MTDIYNLGDGFLTSATYINDQALGGENSMPEAGLCYISLVQKHISGDFPHCLRPTSQKCPVKLLPQPQCIWSPSLHFHKNMSQLSVHVSPSLEEDESAENDEECDRQAGAGSSKKSMGRADEDTTKYQRLKRQKLSDSSHSSLLFSKTPNTQTRTKEKFGDRITALQQLVSPFGKTDTASVLLEAIGYIKFLQDQVQVLSSPYMKPMMGHQGQLEGKGEMICDLKSRGLCLVPVSCTLHVANSNGADYWTSGLGGGNSQH